MTLILMFLATLIVSLVGGLVVFACLMNDPFEPEENP